jgi:hypothetical protein
VIGSDPDRNAGIDGGEPVVRVVAVKRAARGSARQRYRFWRRHTPHYYLVLTAISAAVMVCLLNAWAFLSRSLMVSGVAFAMTLFAALAICTAFFWGFYMIMNGNIPVHRLKVLAPHAVVGFLSPLCYTLNISFDLDGVGSRPISGLSLACSAFCLLLLGVQFTMGKLVVRPEPLRVISRG